MLEYTIKTPYGSETLTSKELLQQYGEHTGFQPIGISQDGSSGIYQTPTGLQTIPFHEALQGVGGDIESYKPQDAKPAENMLKYRMALESISDPDVRQAYFRTVATKDFGQENPMIVNNGTDTYLWDGSKGNWISLTNSPGLDIGDVAAGAASLGKGALSVGGGILGMAGAGLAGLPTGPGALALGAAGAGLGSAAGSALGDLAQAGITSALDPSFRENYSLAKEAGPIAQRASAAYLMGAAGPLVRAALPGIKALNAVRPSQVMQGAGSGIKGAGQMVSSTARGLDTDLGRMGMQMGLDPTGLSGIGALGGFVKENAKGATQAGLKAFDVARGTIADIRGKVAPSQIANAGWEQTAKNAPGIGNFVEGLTSFGGGLEKVGRGMENTIIGAGKGIGAGLRGTGSALQYGGKAVGAAEAPTIQAAASRGLDAAVRPDQQRMWGESNLQNYVQNGLDPAQRMGTSAISQGPQSLQEQIAAQGGLYNMLR